MTGPATEVDRETARVSLSRLELRDFRNFPTLVCDFPEAGVLIVGPNGSGKTNLLESVYYLEIFRSFRGVRDADLVRFGADVFRIEGTARSGGEELELAAAYTKSGRRKKVELGGVEPERLAEVLGKLTAVVFSLDDAFIVSGAPGERRRFLNILLSLVHSGYLENIQRYRAILAQRNEALRSGASASVVQAWTEPLVRPGAAVMAARADWAARRKEAFAAYHERISGGLSATMSYESGLGSTRSTIADGSADDWEEALREALRETSEREQRRGATQVGPHRGDIALAAQVRESEPERDLRTFGSGGQQRTAAIALRLTEADTLEERHGREPVYLLDDVFAELDRERSARVLTLLDEGRSGQVILTAPKRADVPLRGGTLEEWRINDGVLETGS
jgi:DNA replication and repair protein RecF